MSLARGSNFGPYEILAPLGAGGMGEVYKARDTRLGRTVAVKVLPPHTAENPEARLRFEREARAVSSLNHPNICALYDVGREGATDFLVMEYLEGESLAARLAKGMLPVEQALQYGIEVADALAQAHRQGVVHRDVKPGNIMLTKAGTKLLDFGLAKCLGVKSVAVDESTLAASLTREGMVIGTIPYMAPEQLQGKEADTRTDIFALGAVLYEMLAGRRPFTGKTNADLMASILEHQPPPLPGSCSPALARVVSRCLTKDPDQRCQSAWDLKAELQWTRETGTPVGVTAPPPKIQERLAWLVGVAGLLAASIMGIYYSQSVTPPSSLLKLSVVPPAELGSEFGAVISPNGRLLALSGGNERLLWVRSLDSLINQGIPGTEGAYAPFWSTDSRFIGFFAQGKLKKIEVGVSSSYGSPQTLADAPAGRGGTWNRDGMVVFSANLEDGLYQVPAAGGPVTAATVLDRSRQENAHRWPCFLPDGRHFLYWVRSSGESGPGIYVGELGAAPGSQPKNRLLSAISSVTYAAAPSGDTGYLLFEREGMLMAQPFHPGRLQFMGEPVRLANDIRQTSNSRAGFSVSEIGLLTYRTGRSATQFVRFDRSGNREEPVQSFEEFADPRLSPDGKLVALMRLDPQNNAGDIWLLELSRGTTSRLTADPAYDWRPVWSPDGSHVVFASNRKGPMSLYQKLVAGGPEELLLATGYPIVPTDWSSNGHFIVYEQQSPNTKLDLWVLPVNGDRKPFALLQTAFDENQGRLSPDGRWLAYTSNESGADEVYVQGFSGGTRVRISSDGGNNPTWSRNGKELLFLTRDNKLMAAEVKGSSTFELGDIKRLFETPLANPRFTVSADGQQFFGTVPEEGTSTPVTIIVNWAAGLKN